MDVTPAPGVRAATEAERLTSLDLMVLLRGRAAHHIPTSVFLHKHVALEFLEGIFHIYQTGLSRRTAGNALSTRSMLTSTY